MAADQQPGGGRNFRHTVLSYVEEMERLAHHMLPLYAVSLGLPENYFQEAFTNALFRFLMTHYPPFANYEDSQYGIGPHVDTSFFTILAGSSMGLVVHSKRGWVMVDAKEGCLVVNTGQLLQQTSNDFYMAVRHFALNAGSVPRYSLPFFFNANPTFQMSVAPTCISEDNPAKYPPASYLEGQGVAQGE
jgi:isopenicillin N synthase-like dioxygenase